MDAKQIIIDILLKKKIITDISVIKDDMTLEDLDVDSLDLLDIIFEAEGVIQLRIPFEEAKKVKTFQDVIDLIQGLIDNPPQQDPRHVNIEGQPKFEDVVKSLVDEEKNG